LGRAADVASLASLLVSAYAAWQITAVRRKVSRRMAFTALADGFLEDIKEHVASIGEAIRDYPDKRLELLSDIRTCIALLGTYKAELSREGNEALSELRKLSAEYRALVTRATSEGSQGAPSTLIALLWNMHGLIKNCWVDYKNVAAQRRKGVIDDL